MKYQELRDRVEPGQPAQELELVAPFTTPKLTRQAIAAAEKLGEGLHASIRVLKVQVVPFPMRQSPVHLGFLKKQLESFSSTLPLTAHIILARDFEEDLMRSLKPESVVILASKRRPWRTRQESLANALRRAGHRVVLVYEKDNTNA
jgi:hypothetical protein